MLLYRFLPWLLFIAALASDAQKAGPIGQSQATSDRLPAQHLTSEMVDVPSLILTDDGNLIPNLTRSQIAIKLGDKTTFAPSEVHTALHDPISLSIFFDFSKGRTRALKAAADALPAFAAKSLTPADHVSLFALGCSTHSAPPVEPDAVASSLGELFTLPDLKTRPNHHNCVRPTHLLDAIGEALERLHAAHGRRVLLVLSEGNDYTGDTSVSRLHLYAESFGISIFTIRETELEGQSLGLRQTLAGANFPKTQLDPLYFFAVNTGGYVFNVIPSRTSEALQRFLTMLRGRYIVEFPLDGHREDDLYHLHVLVPSLHVEARVSGTFLKRSEGSPTH